jgi:hypothetical protein
LREQPKSPRTAPGPRLVRLNEIELEVVQALRACPNVEQAAVRDAVLAIVRSLTKIHRKDHPQTAEVIALCDPLRKFTPPQV